MGKTKIKTIDDSAPQEEAKVSKPKPAKKGEDALVAKLKKELGMEPEAPKQVKQEAKTQKPGQTKKVRSKKYRQVSKDLDRSKTYPVNEAVDLVKKLSYSKFDGTLEAHINTVQTGLRGLVSLPFQTGKTEYETEAKTPVIHLALGKLNQPNEELTANVKQLITALGKTKVKKVTLSPTMGPGIKLDLTSI